MEIDQSSEQDVTQSLPRREREKLAHRREIIDAATRVFAHKGFFNATLDEIAQEAEFSKGALYLYFSSKEDLLFTIIKEKLGPIARELTEIFAGEASFREELRSLFLYVADMMFKEADFFSLFVSQRSACFRALSGEKAEECMAMHTSFDGFIMDRIKKAIEDGELRDMDPRSIYGVIHGASENMMFTRWGCRTLDELKKGVESFMDILFEGIARKKGGSR